MRTRAIATALLITFAPIATATPVALAQPAQDDALLRQARARFQEGVDYYDKGKFDDARLSFMQAYALRKHPAVLLNLAQSCLKSNHSVEAAKYFQQFLKEGTPSPQQRSDAEHGLNDAWAKVGRVEIIAPAGTEVFLDGATSLGNAPFADPIDVEPGAHSLRSHATDGSGETIRVTASAGQRTQAKFGQGGAAAVVVPVPPPTATNPEVPPPVPTTEPTETPPTPPPTPPDTHPDTGNKPGPLSPPENMIPVYIGAGVGALGILGSIIFALSKSSAQSSADSVDQQIRTKAGQQGFDAKGVCTNPAAKTNFGSACSTYSDDINQVNTDATVANVSLALGIIGLAGAAGWYLFAPKKGEKNEKGEKKSSALSTTEVRPILAPGLGGISIAGHF